MEVRIDKIEYFDIEIGETLVELGSFENLVKNFEKVRELLKKFAGKECVIDATGAVTVEKFDRECEEFSVGNVEVTNCSGRDVVEAVKSLDLGRGSVWVSEDTVHVIEELDGGSVDVTARDFEHVPELLKSAREIFEWARRNYPDAGRIEVSLDDDGCQLDVWVDDVRFVVPCDRKVELVLPEGIETDVVVLTEDVPKVAGIKRVGNVLYHLFMVPLDAVDDYINRWRRVAESLGAKEVEVAEDAFFVLEPALVGIRGGELQYYIESRDDLEFARKFFDAVGLRDKFDEEMKVIARLLEGFDGGLLDGYREATSRARELSRGSR